MGENPSEKLNRIFDMTEEVLLDQDKQLTTIETRVLDEDKHAEEDEILSFQTLKTDYFFIKETVIENILLGKTLLKTVVEKMEDDVTIDEKAVLTCVELIKANNISLKQLSNIFKEIKEIEKMNRGEPLIKGESGGQTTNYFVGNLNDVLKLKK